MQRKLQMSGRDPSAFVQQISIYVSSRFLPFESLAFNRVRAQRFGGGGGGGGVHGHSLPAAIAEKRSGNLDADMAQLRCGMPGASDFCDPQNRTLADDRVGYLFNDYAVAFSNMGRLNPLHGVIATRDFASPLHLSRSEVVGMFSLAHDWFARSREAHASDSPLFYPTFTWDLLRNGGASQAHPHIQPHLGTARYPGRWEAYRLAACQYSHAHAGSSLFADVATVHSQLGLIVRRTSHVIAFVSLTSVAAGPMIELIADRDGADEAALVSELGAVFHEVVQAAQAALGWEGFSSSCAFPPMASARAAGDAPSSVTGGLPRICRVVPRGRYDALVSDLSANELFETPSVSIDLFEAARRMRQHVHSTHDQEVRRR